jgi:hypothetical protein
LGERAQQVGGPIAQRNCEYRRADRRPLTEQSILCQEAPTRLLEDAAITDDFAYRGVAWHLVDVAKFDHTVARGSLQQNALGAWVYVIAGNASIGTADLTA